LRDLHLSRAARTKHLSAWVSARDHQAAVLLAQIWHAGKGAIWSGREPCRLTVTVFSVARGGSPGPE
jgi:2,4-dienoyl-CoA reductase-like NADH-dependent reductase (Old Yellow Enzyme family)